MLLQVDFHDSMASSMFITFFLFFSFADLRSLALKFKSLQTETACSNPKGYELSQGKKLKVVHRYGICSPIGPSERPTIAEILMLDQQLFNYIKKRAKLETTQVTIREQDSKLTVPSFSGQPLGTGNYVVNVSLGTPANVQTIIIDTGSNICWVQCEPCTDCYNQLQPKFDPRKSSSYKNLSCSSTRCSLFNGNSCDGTTCTYEIDYLDNSMTTGTVGQDVLTLGQKDTFKGFTFGCGHHDNGTFEGIAGLFGLGRDSTSLISQTSKSYGNIFSYCLPDFTTNSIGFLNLGGPTNATGFSYTPMLEFTNDISLYALNLTGISVGGQQLSITPTVFSTVPNIIDSGTVITRLPSAAYEALRAAFLMQMSAYPRAPNTGFLDTCFNFRGFSNVKVPEIILQFARGATMNLESLGIIFPGAQTSRGCLAFTKGSFVLLGNAQQSGFEVVYDIGNKRIGFKPSAC